MDLTKIAGTPILPRLLKANDLIRVLKSPQPDPNNPHSAYDVPIGSMGRVGSASSSYIYLTDLIDPATGHMIPDVEQKKILYVEKESESFAHISARKEITAVTTALKAAKRACFVDWFPQWRLVTSGGDPEVFVLDGKGEVMPAFTFLPEKKADTLIFWDGHQAEFTFPHAGCLQSMMGGVYQGLNGILRLARVVDPKAKLSLQGVVDVREADLRKLPEEQVILGCSPSLNIYPDVQPVDVGDPYTLPIRFAGAHMHFGFYPSSINPCTIPDLIRALDYILGPIMVALFQGLEDPRRRMYYGRAGEYRTPPHGLEYRVPPSWILIHPAITHLCYEMARQAMGLMVLGYFDQWKAEEGEVRDVINSSDVQGAKKILVRNERIVKGLFNSVFRRYGKLTASTLLANALTLFEDGVKEHISLDPEDNWGNLGKGSWNGGVVLSSGDARSQTQFSYFRLPEKTETTTAKKPAAVKTKRVSSSS